MKIVVVVVMNNHFWLHFMMSTWLNSGAVAKVIGCRFDSFCWLRCETEADHSCNAFTSWCHICFKTASITFSINYNHQQLKSWSFMFIINYIHHKMITSSISNDILLTSASCSWGSAARLSNCLFDHWCLWYSCQTLLHNVLYVQRSFTHQVHAVSNALRRTYTHTRTF